MTATRTMRAPDELTPKQLLSIPIVAISETVSAGAHELVRQEICNERTFWRWWSEEPEYRSRVEKERAIYQSTVLDQVRQRARVSLHKRYEQLERCCEDGAVNGQVNAIKLAMLLAGISEFGSNTNVKVGVSAHAIAHSGEASDNAFVERASAVGRARAGVVAVITTED